MRPFISDPGRIKPPALPPELQDWRWRAKKGKEMKMVIKLIQERKISLALVEVKGDGARTCDRPSAD